MERPLPGGGKKDRDRCCDWIVSVSDSTGVPTSVTTVFEIRCTERYLGRGPPPTPLVPNFETLI